MTEFGWCDSRQISIFVIANQFNKLFSSFMAASCNRAYIRSLQRSTHQLMIMIGILINIVIATMVISWVAPSLSPSSVTREAARATANCWQGGLGGWDWDGGKRGGNQYLLFSPNWCLLDNNEQSDLRWKGCDKKSSCSECWVYPT